MGKIEIVSASAGSGKTYTITELVLDRLKSKAAAPESLLATTFTNKAAAELQQRIRARLFKAGMVEEAQRIEGARIGTVNSVCGRLLQEFAFELGLSPAQRVLDEEAALVALRRAASRVVTTAEAERLTACQRAFQHWKDKAWPRQVATIIDQARANRIDPKDFPSFAQRSLASLLAHLPKPAKSGAPLEKKLETALADYLVATSRLAAPKKKTETSIQTVRTALGQLRRGAMPWDAWMRLSKLDPAVEARKDAQKVIEAAGDYGTHPQLHADIRDYTELVFDVAARALGAYAAEKAEWGVVDFVDQEARALELLDRKDVADRLRAELDLLVVDEFQDTSPIQLALFARLSELAKESVWVGDPKQAIFGFRGTDPALMDAALAALHGKAKVRTLDTSYRSRAPLVELTSKLFVPPFEAQGLPPDRVVLKPKSPTDDPAFGPFVESWTLDAPRAAETAIALAHCVEQLLADPTAVVRDPVTDAPRRVVAGDVAVLCRSNARCSLVAQHLVQRGIRAAVARPGLLGRPEARLALAALRLFVDPRDSLAAAELELLQTYADDPDGWLNAVLKPREKGVLVFADAAVHSAMKAARERFPAAGPLAALDAALEAAQARETCLRWGDSAGRHANLDALRAHAHEYVRACETGGAAATPAGLLAHFAELAGSEADAQAMVTGGDAVTVLTWHRSKGLEWPVVVLDNLNAQDRARLWGATVQTDAKTFDFEAPLAKRWIRFWPHPFGQQSSSDFHERVDASPESELAWETAEREGLRLLYVGWTRPRDRLALALKGGGYKVAQLARFDVKEVPQVTEPDDQGNATWAGTPLVVKVRVGTAVVQAGAAATPDAAPVPAGEQELPLAWLSPSKFDGKGKAGAPVEIGVHRYPKGKVDMDQLGMALHAFLAADFDGLDATKRLALAERCLRNRGVEGALAPADVVQAGDALKAWAAKVAPGATWRRELPLSHPLKDGSTVRGTADLVLETAAGLVLVDHKSYPGKVEQAVARAAEYAGQLAAYGDALAAATGKKVLGFHVHLPLAGLVVPVTP